LKFPKVCGGVAFLVFGFVLANFAHADSKNAKGTKSGETIAEKSAAPAAVAEPPLTEVIDQAIRDSNLQLALSKVQAGLASTPGDVELIWRYSRILVLTGDQEANKDKQLALYEQAKAQGDKAVQVADKNMMAYLRRAAANGKVALFRGVLQARELVLQTREDTQKAIELNNSTPYALALAHYILGRAHHKLSETPKAIRMPLGLAWGNLAEAEQNLAKAVQLFSGSVSFRTDYGKLLLETGKVSEGREQLNAALKLPNADPGDTAKKAEATALLR
jgi:tetratricopeptide (TPR) repeat protein